MSMLLTSLRHHKARLDKAAVHYAKLNEPRRVGYSKETKAIIESNIMWFIEYELQNAAYEMRFAVSQCQRRFDYCRKIAIITRIDDNRVFSLARKILGRKLP